MKLLLNYFSYPVYVLTGMSLYFSLSSNLRSEMSFKGVLFGITFAVFGLILLQEKYLPFRKDWTKSLGDEISDGLQSALIFPIISEIIYKSMNFLTKNPLSGLWPHEANVVVQVFLILVIAEWFHYWYHRISHRKKWLWKFHTIHHGALRVYSLNSARFHVVDIFFNMLFYLAPLSLFGVSQEVYFGFLLINSLTGLLEHANIRFEAGPLNYIFNTAQLHRWHHSEISKESQKNFGKVLCIWDLVHKSHFLPKERSVETVGIGKRGQVPPTFWAQTLYPYKKNK